jgi:hypothetical protein
MIAYTKDTVAFTNERDVFGNPIPDRIAPRCQKRLPQDFGQCRRIVNDDGWHGGSHDYRADWAAPR